MKKIICTLYGIIALSTGLGTINAKCNDDSINVLMEEVIVNSSGVLATGEEERDQVFLFIENIPEDTYVIVINNTLNQKETIKEINDGIIQIETPNPNKIYDYTVKFYSSSSVCENELIRSVNAKSLAYNSYYRGEYCRELRDEEEVFDGCNAFASKIYNDEIFNKELEEYMNKKPETMGNKILDLFYKYYYYALIPIALLFIYYSIRLALIRRRKKKNEEQ